MQAVGRELERTGSAALVALMAFDWQVLGAARRQMPQVASVALTEQQPGEDTVRVGAAQPSPWLGGVDPARFGNSVERLVQATGAGTWGPDYLDLDAGRVQRAHALGLRVVPWTVNEPADMQRLLGFNVDGMVTDRPDVLRALLAERGLELPARAPGVSSRRERHAHPGNRRQPRGDPRAAGRRRRPALPGKATCRYCRASAR